MNQSTQKMQSHDCDCHIHEHLLPEKYDVFKRVRSDRDVYHISKEINSDIHMRDSQ